MSRLLNYFYFVMFSYCFYSLIFIVLFVGLSPLFPCLSFSLAATYHHPNKPKLRVELNLSSQNYGVIG